MGIDYKNYIDGFKKTFQYNFNLLNVPENVTFPISQTSDVTDSIIYHEKIASQKALLPENRFFGNFEDVLEMSNTTFNWLKDSFKNLASIIGGFRSDGIGVFYDDSTQFSNTAVIKQTSFISKLFCVNSNSDLTLNGTNIPVYECEFFYSRGFNVYGTMPLSVNQVNNGIYENVEIFVIPQLHFGKSFNQVPYVFSLNPTVFYGEMVDSLTSEKIQSLYVDLDPKVYQVSV